MEILYIKQLRAARALLGWSQQNLADNSDVPLPTIKRLEKGDGLVKGRSDNVWKIQECFDKNGIEFLSQDGKGLGVKFKNYI